MYPLTMYAPKTIEQAFYWKKTYKKSHFSLNKKL